MICLVSKPLFASSNEHTRDAVKKGEDTSEENREWSSNNGCSGGDSVHSGEQPNNSIEESNITDKMIDDLVKLVNNSPGEFKIYNCRYHRKRSSEVAITLPAVPFFRHNSKIIVYVNKELPIFIGISLNIFPDMANLLGKINRKESINMLKTYFISSGKIAMITCLLQLLSTDENLRIMMDMLNEINENIRKRRIQKRNIQSMKRFLETVGGMIER